MVPELFPTRVSIYSLCSGIVTKVEAYCCKGSGPVQEHSSKIVGQTGCIGGKVCRMERSSSP